MARPGLLYAPWSRLSWSCTSVSTDLRRPTFLTTYSWSLNFQADNAYIHRWPRHWSYHRLGFKPFAIELFPSQQQKHGTVCCRKWRYLDQCHHQPSNLNLKHFPVFSWSGDWNASCTIPLKTYVMLCYVMLCQVVQALGNSYHRSCFRCSCCNECIGEMPFTVDTDKHLLCLPDYYRLIYTNHYRYNIYTNEHR